jgi:tetratricopeptide (TPR) repeat protein
MNEGGRFKDALALCNRAIGVLPKSAEEDTEKAYGKEALRCKGEALLGLGRADEAAVVLERSITLKRRAHSPDLARAELAVARSLVALHKDPARALALAKSAREEMGWSPHLKIEIGRIEAFVRGLGGGT